LPSPRNSVTGPVDQEPDLLRDRAVLGIVAGPLQRALDHRVEELARGEQAAGEEALVGQRHAQHRNLQAREQRLARRLRAGVGAELVAQHPDQLERVRVGVREVRRLAVRRELAQLVDQVLLDVGDGARHQLPADHDGCDGAFLHQAQHLLDVLAACLVRGRRVIAVAQLMGVPARVEQLARLVVKACVLRVALRREPDRRLPRRRPTEQWVIEAGQVDHAVAQQRRGGGGVLARRVRVSFVRDRGTALGVRLLRLLGCRSAGHDRLGRQRERTRRCGGRGRGCHRRRHRERSRRGRSGPGAAAGASARCASGRDLGVREPGRLGSTRASARCALASS
jgi:hypothetical protein